MHRESSPKSFLGKAGLILITLLIFSLFFIFLANRPLFVPDEGRYAEIAREMVDNANYVTPTLNGIKYFEKPVLFYWLGAGAIKLLGTNIWALRSINAFFGLLGCLLTYLTARRLYGQRTGMLAAFILASNPLYFVMARTISLDLLVTFFIAASLFSAILLAETTTVRKVRYLSLFTAAASACAVLTKGLIGIVFPGLIIMTWVTLTQRWDILKKLLNPFAIVAFLMIVIPWHYLVGKANPEFFYFYFVEQHFLRYTLKEIGHYQPIWFFIPCVVLGFFPWIAFLPQALGSILKKIWRMPRHHHKELFLLLWVFIIFTFFSFSKSKLIPYILPMFPPLAILTAQYLNQQRTLTNAKSLRFGIYIFAALACSIAVAAILGANILPLTSGFHTTFYLYAIAGLLLLASMICLMSNQAQAFGTICLTSYLFLLLIIGVLPGIDTRTIQPLAFKLKPLLTAQDEVVTYNRYYQDLPFYLQRRVSILNWKNELSFGMKHQDTRDFMLTDADLKKRWNSGKKIYLIIGKDEFSHFKVNPTYTKPVTILGETLTTLLVTNATNDHSVDKS